MFCWQAEDGIRDRVRSRGLGEVYKRHGLANARVLADHLRDGGYDLILFGKVAVDDYGQQTLSLIHI